MDFLYKQAWPDLEINRIKLIVKGGGMMAVLVYSGFSKIPGSISQLAIA